MTRSKITLSAIALLVALGGAGATLFPVEPSLAQAAAPGAPPAERPSHIEGRIAFLKTELHITPAQEAQWAKVADAMRQDSTEMRQQFEQMRADRNKPQTALQHLERRARFEAIRARQTDRFLAAFRPLYDGMTPDQKKTADDLLAPHWDHRRHHRI